MAIVFLGLNLLLPLVFSAILAAIVLLIVQTSRFVKRITGRAHSKTFSEKIGQSDINISISNSHNQNRNQEPGCITTTSGSSVGAENGTLHPPGIRKRRSSLVQQATGSESSGINTIVNHDLQQSSASSDGRAGNSNNTNMKYHQSLKTSSSASVQKSPRPQVASKVYTDNDGITSWSSLENTSNARTIQRKHKSLASSNRVFPITNYGFDINDNDKPVQLSWAWSKKSDSLVSKQMSNDVKSGFVLNRKRNEIVSTASSYDTHKDLSFTPKITSGRTK